MNLCQNIIMTSRGQAARLSRLCALDHRLVTTKVHKLASKVHNTATKVHKPTTKVHNADYNDYFILPYDY